MSCSKLAASASSGPSAGGKRKTTATRTRPDKRQHAKRGKGEAAPAAAPVAAAAPAAAAAAAPAAAAAAAPDAEAALAATRFALTRDIALIQHELDRTDTTPDEPDMLRRAIDVLLPARPIRDHFANRRLKEGKEADAAVVNAAVFAAELKLNDDCRPGTPGATMLVYTICSSPSYQWSISQASQAMRVSKARELSLLLRLLVALGVDLNAPIQRVYRLFERTPPLGEEVKGFDEPVVPGTPFDPCDVHATTAIAAYLPTDHVALAIAMAGPKLKIDWCVRRIPPVGRPIYTAAASFLSVAFDSDLCRPQWSGVPFFDASALEKRMMAITGEAALYYSTSYCSSVYNAKLFRYIPDCPLLSENDHSEFLLPMSMDMSRHQLRLVHTINLRRRQGRNQALTEFVKDAEVWPVTQARPQLWALIVSYARLDDWVPPAVFTDSLK